MHLLASDVFQKYIYYQQLQRCLQHDNQIFCRLFLLINTDEKGLIEWVKISFITIPDVEKAGKR